MGKNKRGAADALTIIAVLILGLFAIDYFGIYDIGSAIGGEKEEPPPDGGVQTCGDVSNTIKFGPQQQKWQPATSMASEQMRVFRNGIDQGNKTDSTTDTYNWKDEVEIVYGFDSSVYYADYAKFSMPCGPTDSAKPLSGLDAQYEGAYQLIKNGTATFDIFNSDTGNKNPGTGTDNETVSSGETARFELRRYSTSLYTGTSPIRHGPASVSKILLVVEMNGTDWDRSLTTLGAKPAQGINLPQGYSLASLDSETALFEVPGCPSGDKQQCDENWGWLEVKAKSGQNPGDEKNGCTVADGSGLKVSVIEQDFDLHTISNEILFGYEDDVGTFSGFARSAIQSATLCVT